MRTLSSAEQEERKRRLLQAIIHQFIKTGKPVGSVVLAEQIHLDLSSATIRNVMADLEIDGYLSHPHTSAGRVPTDKAYRFYVDSLAALQRLALMEEERIKRDYEARVREIEELMLSTSKTLSVMSQYTGFATTPTLEQARLRHLQLVPLDSHRVLVVLVSDTGIVRQRVVMFDGAVSHETLQRMSELLNEHLRGRAFGEVRDEIVDHLEAARLKHLEMLDLAREISRQAFDARDENEVYIEGAGNILSLPDFQDQDQMRSLVRLLDEKRALGEILERDLAAPGGRPGVRVKIGSELKSPNFRNVSLISSAYTIGDRTVGVLGIIGPKRMEYSKMIALVDHVAKAVTGVLNRLIGPPSGTDAR